MHLEILKWARGQGCPWNERTCRYAAGMGHFELLKWARGQGCPCQISERSLINESLITLT